MISMFAVFTDVTPLLSMRPPIFAANACIAPEKFPKPMAVPDAKMSMPHFATPTAADFTAIGFPLAVCFRLFGKAR